MDLNKFDGFKMKHWELESEQHNTNDSIVTEVGMKKAAEKTR